MQWRWRKKGLFCCLFLFFINGSSAQPAAAVYPAFFPAAQCDSTAFALAWKGYHILNKAGLLANPRYLTIVDFTKASNQQRFFVLDVPARRLILSSITAHGIGSDPDSTTRPYRFSNRNNSRMSSIGFYLTGDTYYNQRPQDSLGLCLFGLDKGYNDSAAAREIVIHYGATERSGYVYVTDSGAARSFGCPALPLAHNSLAINLIKGGSCLFIYSANVPDYPHHGTVLHGRLPRHIRQQGPPPNSCQCDLKRSH